MKTLSKQHEERLISAVKEAVDHVDNHGATPDAAIAKVARDGKWNREWIKLAAHAYNTGRQTAQREVGESLLDKFAAFPLVDPANVIKKLWPSKVKTAADINQEVGVSDDYARPPAWVGRSSPTAHLKTAEFKLVDEPPPVLEIDSDTRMKRAYNAHVGHKRATEEARTQVGMARDRFLNKLGALGDFFKKHARDRNTFADVEHAVQTYYPGSALTLMDYVYNRNRMKEARAADTPMSTVRMNRDAAPFTLIDACMTAGRVVKQAEDNHVMAQMTMAKQAEELRPFGQTPSPKTVNQTLSLIPEGAAVKQANIMGGALVAASTQDLLRRALSDAPETTSDLRQDELLELTDPTHEAELRKIRAQALMSDVMTDPVIGGYEPHEVFRAYNELSQLAPRAAMQPMAVRPMLRRYLQGNMEPFEAKEVTDIEKGMRDIERPTPMTTPESSDDVS